MNDNADIFIQKCLKNWAAEQNPPDEVRSRVIHAASPFYLKLLNNGAFSTDVNRPMTALTSCLQPISRRNDIRGQTQLWAWHMTMTTLRFFA